MHGELDSTPLHDATPRQPQLPLVRGEFGADRILAIAFFQKDREAIMRVRSLRLLRGVTPEKAHRMVTLE
jgi:hypothetical protein